MATTLAREETRGRTRQAVIDCDIHNAPASDEALRKYLPAEWRDYHTRVGGAG